MAKKTAKTKEVAKKKAPAKKAEAVKPELVGVTELLAEVVAETGNEAVTEADVKAVFSAVMNLNAENKNIQIIGFGNFEVRGRAERKGRNPQTGDEITIAASILPALKTGATYKRLVKEQSPERKVPKKKVKEVEADVVEEPKESTKKSKKKSKLKKKKGSK